MNNVTLQINPEKRGGPIRPMNGVGGGPVTYNMSYDASAWFRAAHIPFCRTHDIEYPFGSGEYVDVHNLFPDFDKDENDPANYNFALTDLYMQHIEEVGAKPIYRLGSCIEHQPIKRHIHPPKDFAKWGRICSRIIAHYNEGWGNGMHLGITYWEIWNEPDIPQCWTGTQEQFLDLYEAAATVIKREHPDVKIGGLAFANPCGEMVDKFLDRCAEKNVPIDFLSWHAYVRLPGETARYAAAIRETLKRHGMSHLESIYDEWNYVMGWEQELEKSFEFHKTVGEAAFMGAVMTTAHENGVDISCYYDVQFLMERVWNGVFEPGPRSAHGCGGKSVKPLPGFYALQYWGELTSLAQVEAATNADDLYVTAGVSDDGQTVKVMVSQFSDNGGYGIVAPNPKNITLSCTGDYAPVSVWVTDALGNHRPVTLEDGTLPLRGYAIALITFQKK